METDAVTLSDVVGAETERLLNAVSMTVKSCPSISKSPARVDALIVKVNEPSNVPASGLVALKSAWTTMYCELPLGGGSIFEKSAVKVTLRLVMLRPSAGI